MYQKTIDSIGQQVLDFYNEGLNSLQISKRVGASKTTVKKVLLHFGIDYTAEYKYKQEEKRRRVVEMYYQGISQLEIEKQLHITRKNVREILDAHEGRRSLSQAHLLTKGNSINEQAFDDLTVPDVAYWIGFLYADGHVSNKHNLVEVGLIDSDKEHLEKLKRFLNTNSEIKITNNGGNKYRGKRFKCRLRIYSEVIANRFRELGFDNQKSYTAKPIEELLYSRDFWRGVIDGDGCLHFIKSYELPMLHLCGTKETINGFISFIKQQGLIIDKVPGKAKGKSLHQVAFYKEAVQVADLLYKDASTYLDRKYKIYQEWINN